MLTSFWKLGAQPTYPSLGGQSLETDVVIVGGGITGLTTAWLLQRRGIRCILVEQEQLGFGTTGATSAHLTEVLDIGYVQLVHDFGQEAAQLVTAAYRTALTSITAFASAYDVSCRPLDGFRFTEDESEIDQLKQEAETARKLGIRCELIGNVPLPRARAAVRFPNQARFHPQKYLRAMAEEFVEEGGLIFEHSRALKWEEADSVTLYLENGEIRGRTLVLATHTPIRFNLLQTELGPYTSYLVAMALEGEIRDALYWDTARPYHYLRLLEHEGQPLLLVGGEDHKTGQEPDPESRFRSLEAFARERYDVGQTMFHWSHELFEPADGLPYIGRSPGSERVLLGTGYSGVGLTGGTLAALILADMASQKENPWAEVFRPSRFKPAAGASNFLRENADVALRWVADRLTGSELQSLDELPAGEGAVLRLQGRQVAIYRGEDGHLTVRSPVCTHLGCIVGWNSSEKTWDCPCHGGRYHATGEVLNGPPVRGLDPVELEEIGKTGEKPAQNIEQRF